MTVTAWTNGGTVFGIRVGRPNVREFFQPGWETVEILAGEEWQEYRLWDTFWTSCPELRGGLIGRWLRREGLAPWNKGEAPRLELIPLGVNRFRLTHPPISSEIA